MQHHSLGKSQTLQLGQNSSLAKWRLLFNLHQIFSSSLSWRGRLEGSETLRARYGYIDGGTWPRRAPTLKPIRATWAANDHAYPKPCRATTSVYHNPLLHAPSRSTTSIPPLPTRLPRPPCMHVIPTLTPSPIPSPSPTHLPPLLTPPQIPQILQTLHPYSPLPVPVPHPNNLPSTPPPPIAPPAPPFPPLSASLSIQRLKNSRSRNSSPLVTFVLNCASWREKDRSVGNEVI